MGKPVSYEGVLHHPPLTFYCLRCGAGYRDPAKLFAHWVAAICGEPCSWVGDDPRLP